MCIRDRTVGVRLPPPHYGELRSLRFDLTAPSSSQPKDAEVFKRVFVPGLPNEIELILADTGYDRRKPLWDDDGSCYEVSDAKVTLTAQSDLVRPQVSMRSPLTSYAS